jgi:hypothetical protein
MIGLNGMFYYIGSIKIDLLEFSFGIHVALIKKMRGTGISIFTTCQQ